MNFPELDPTKPHIAVLIPTEDGYRAETLCLVDGRPARVSIDVDTHKFRYSSYSIAIWDAVMLQWAKVYNLTGQDVGPMSLLHDSLETQEKVNSIAELLWWQANVIVSGGRKRTEEVEIDFEMRKAQAIALAVQPVPPVYNLGQPPAAAPEPSPEQVQFIADREVGTEIINLLEGLRDRKFEAPTAEPGDPNWLDDSDLAALRDKLSGDA